MYKPAFYDWTDIERAAKNQHAEIARITGLGATGRLLEIGSGGGGYLEYFQNHGWECLGVEDDDTYSPTWMEKNILTLQGTVTEIGIPANSYDLVRIRGALNGEEKLSETLSILYDAVHSTGYLIVDVWNQTGFPARPGGDQPVNQFNKSFLQKLLEDAGFDVGGMIATHIGDEIWAPLKPKSKHKINIVSRTIDKVMGLFDQGSLLIAFAQRPPR